MKITRTSIFSGITRTHDLPITPEQWEAYSNGMKIQNAFPQLSPEEREFILTGATQEEWDKAFPEDEEE